MPDACSWCGHPRCDGDQRTYPHHSLCCMDGPRQACWGKPDAEAQERIAAVLREERWG